LQLLLDSGDVPLTPPPLGSSSRNVGSRPFTSSRRHRSRKQSDGKVDVPVWFKMLQQILHYNVSYPQDIGHNLSSAGST